ncbi:hypothetical protein HNQ64_002648 [Prosthecobacter dejongeii]|uniref:Uncharacterized protein n=1 Tax=Prosthecobacter dejongeii TaxID=48465 RepID=A0A7W7YLX8_9BACT|nr:hypothetical protein [Prosthecobacter dejongeii]
MIGPPTRRAGVFCATETVSTPHPTAELPASVWNAPHISCPLHLHRKAGNPAITSKNTPHLSAGHTRPTIPRMPSIVGRVCSAQTTPHPPPTPPQNYPPWFGTPRKHLLPPKTEPPTRRAGVFCANETASTPDPTAELPAWFGTPHKHLLPPKTEPPTRRAGVFCANDTTSTL